MARLVLILAALCTVLVTVSSISTSESPVTGQTDGETGTTTSDNPGFSDTPTSAEPPASSEDPTGAASSITTSFLTLASTLSAVYALRRVL